MLTNGELILATYFGSLGHQAAGDAYTHLINPDVVGSPLDNPESYPALCGTTVQSQQLRWGTVLENRREIAFNHEGASSGVPLSVAAIISCPRCRQVYQAE
jgi:hypothetical protein